MSRKDYQLIARAIVETEDGAADSMGWRKAVAETLARLLKADNPAFQPAKFLAACKVS